MTQSSSPSLFCFRKVMEIIDDQRIVVANNNERSRNNQYLLQLIPSWFQNYLRDSGLLRSIIDATLARLALDPIFYYKNPNCFPDFIRISTSEYPH